MEVFASMRYFRCCFALLILLCMTSCKRHYYPQVLVCWLKAPEDPNAPPKWPMAFRASDGLAEYEDEAYGGLQTVNGAIDLNRTTVKKYVVTDDDLAAEDSDIAGLDVGGKAWIRKSVVHGNAMLHDSARFYDSTVSGNLKVCGPFYACGTSFKGDVWVGDLLTANNSTFGRITAKAEMIDLNASTAQSILVEPTGPYYDPQVVRLANGSSVAGDITFKSGRGKVCVESGSTVRGQIIGGNIIKPHYWQSVNPRSHESADEPAQLANHVDWE